MDIVTTSNFHATLLQQKLIVVFLSNHQLRQCSWPLLKLLLYASERLNDSNQAEIFSIVVEKDGVTIFMDPSGIELFKIAELEPLLTIAPDMWCAVQIHLGPLVAEFPGINSSFLSKLLAEDDISILNLSTFDTDIIFVRETNLEVAISCLKSKLSRGFHGLKEAKEAERDLVFDFACNSHLVGQRIHSPSKIVAHDQYLVVFPESFVLVRLRKESIRSCAFGLTQMVLMSPCDPQSPSISFWCYCETAEEISLVVDERSLLSFPQEAVVVAPDRWRAIKLCGRLYGFDETGVVAAMSGLDSQTQVLNFSSFGSNVTMVLSEALDVSLEALRRSLSISRVQFL
ncbi:unnamed protein product [Albugo candida]|uniref:CASTOR ACT domain-containing protein n=1 Tax=Albugo candida TaxID=65357 RepID=A0A024G517_9STRA|nr:unnamed protein product [Albugo candida]|eukprot:CCI41934.1 unnamed protein product [Albugo candida]